MSYTIAISGKGGVGKTTIAGLFISRLIAKNHRPVLAVDADPNSCLDEVLGVQLEKTIGGVREEAKEVAGKGFRGTPHRGKTKGAGPEFPIGLHEPNLDLTDWYFCTKLRSGCWMSACLTSSEG